MTIRIAVMLAALVAALALHAAWRAAGRASPWPRRLLAVVARIAGVRLRVEGTIAPPPVLILANHVSWIDICAIAGASGSAFVANYGLADFAALRWLCALNHTIFVDRTRRGEIGMVAHGLRKTLAGGAILTLFPEGTTGDGVTLGGFKSSLLAALEPPVPGLAVQPVWLDYGDAAPDIAWTGAEPGRRNFLRILARRPGIALTLRFLDPLTGAECTSRKTAAAAARARIDAAMRGGDQRVAL